MTGKMAAISYTLLLLSVIFISCRAAGAAGTEADEAGTKTDEAGTKAPPFDELESAETKSDASSDRSITTDDDKLETLIRNVQDVRISLGLLRNDIMILLEDQPAGDCVYKNCEVAFRAGHTTSGVYTIKPDGVNEVDAYCEQEEDGGGWTVFQRRINGSVDFYRDWAVYKKGFGKASGEYWLGNDHIHALTTDHKQKMKVELQYGGDTRYADYDSFWIDSVSNNYTLTVLGYTGTAGDSLNWHNGRPFTTRDRDNDNRSYSNCAQQYSGAWWYHSCYRSNLNGLYNNNRGSGVAWYDWKVSYASMSATRMMVKPR